MFSCDIWSAVAAEPSNLTIASAHLREDFVIEFTLLRDVTARHVNLRHMVTNVLVHIPSEGEVFELANTDP